MERCTGSTQNTVLPYSVYVNPYMGISKESLLSSRRPILWPPGEECLFTLLDLLTFLAIYFIMTCILLCLSSPPSHPIRLLSEICKSFRNLALVIRFLDAWIRNLDHFLPPLNFRNAVLNSMWNLGTLWNFNCSGPTILMLEFHLFISFHAYVSRLSGTPNSILSLFTRTLCLPPAACLAELIR